MHCLPAQVRFAYGAQAGLAASLAKVSATLLVKWQIIYSASPASLSLAGPIFVLSANLKTLSQKGPPSRALLQSSPEPRSTAARSSSRSGGACGRNDGARAVYRCDYWWCRGVTSGGVQVRLLVRVLPSRPPMLRELWFPRTRAPQKLLSGAVEHVRQDR